MTRMRLQRALARAGIASRRASEDLIRAGKVRVNGEVALVGTVVDPDEDLITVGRQRVQPSRAKWLVLNKPPGFVVSKRDPVGRHTVFELVPELPGLTYVGRLDVATDGLLLFTTDGTVAHRLTHPSFHVSKSYVVQVRGGTVADLRRRLSRPIIIGDRPVDIERFQVRALADELFRVELTIHEGRNRIVRRLFDVLGLRVERLTRTGHGPIHLGSLGQGSWRYLTAAERSALAGTGVKSRRARSS